MSDEFELFRREMNGVTPIAGEDVADIRTAFEPTLAQQQRRQAAEKDHEQDLNYLSTEYVDLVEPDDELSFRRDGVQHGVFKRLRQGRYTLEASLNLHQMRLEEGRKAVCDFVNDCYRTGIRTALVIHGMGRKRQPQQALMKSYVNKWLRELEPVMAFHSAQRPHGGRGALYMMLRKNAEQKLLNKERHQRR